ncbi:MAG: hypothetical protein ACRDHY_18190, partial [Anaerolineales bacterium]
MRRSLLVAVPLAALLLADIFVRVLALSRSDPAASATRPAATATPPPLPATGAPPASPTASATPAATETP